MPLEPPTGEAPVGNWTRVTSKRRRNHAASALSTVSAAPVTKPPVISPVKTASELQEEYTRISSQWRESKSHDALVRLVRANAGDDPKITRAICLGIGSFDPEHGGWEAKRRAFIQLAAFLTMVDVLVEVGGRPIPCMFQEPVFSTADVAFVENLGHKILQSPDAFRKVKGNSLLFGIHLYRPVYEEALAGGLPRIFVGTGWDVWDSVGGGESQFESMEAMERTFKRVPFPQDENFTFSSTSLYWDLGPDNVNTRPDVTSG